MSAQRLADALVGPSVVVQVKHEFGVRRIYPVCERARLFSEIAGTKTLSPEDITAIRRLGFIVDNAPEEI